MNSLIEGLLSPSRARQAVEALRRKETLPRLLAGDGRQLTAEQLRVGEERQRNTQRLQSLLNAPLAAGAYGLLDSAGAPEHVRDSVTGMMAGAEGLAYAPSAASVRRLATALRGQQSIVPNRDPPPTTGKPAKPDFTVAYHASPHNWERFRLRQIGTGEGAQAYGHGGYAAESPEVAEAYQRGLGNRPVVRVRGSVAAPAPSGRDSTPYDPVRDAGNLLAATALKAPGALDVAALLKDAKVTAAANVRRRALEVEQDEKQWKGKPSAMRGALAKQEAVRRALDDLKESEVEATRPGAMLYGLALPARDRLLDYDRPIAEQPPRVREMLDAAGLLRIPARTGGDLYSNWQTPKDASAALLRAGIPGLQYLDSGSRHLTKDRPTHNFVVWDEPRLGTIGKAKTKRELDEQIERVLSLFADERSP